MSKMKSGWHKQPLRHSRARRFGKAGGIYASERIRTILKKHPEYKNLNIKQLRGKGIFLKYGNPIKQDEEIKLKPMRGTQLMREMTKEEKKPIKQKAKETAKKIGKWVGKEAKIGYEKTKEFVKKETPKVEAFVKKEATAVKEKVKKEYEEYGKKRREAVAKAVAQATQQKIVDEQTEEEKEELIDKLSEETQAFREMEQEEAPSHPELDVSQIFSQLKPEEAMRIAEQTTKALTKVEHKKIDDLASVDVKELSDEELKMITVRLGTGFFGQGNKFESEIKRRIRERERVETDLKIELEKAQIESKKRLEQLREGLTKQGGGYIWDNLFGTTKK
jgi:hypothetical protein